VVPVPSILTPTGAVRSNYGACLVSTNPPIRRVNSSHISGASPTFQVLQPTIYLIRKGGGVYILKNVSTVTLSQGGAYSEGEAYMPDYTVLQSLNEMTRRKEGEERTRD
jgi:hypothetical protein